MVIGAQGVSAWLDDPVLFVRECLGAEPDDWQVEVLQAVMEHDRIALKASKGPGKSTVLAWLAWWFLLTRPHPKVVATSITADNLKDGLWTEMAKWQGRSETLRQSFQWTAERVVSKDHPQTWWASARAWSRSADASAQADTLAGLHADHMLFLVDEAGGVPDAVMAAAEAGLANADPARGTEAKLVLAGNPTRLEGPLYRACTRERAMWWVKEISGDPDDPGRAPRVSAQWAKEQIEKYGRENPWVAVNVFGKFPAAQSDSLVSLSAAEEASRRTLTESEYLYAPKVLGVDVARFGDDRTCLFPRQGRVAFRPKVLRNLDTMEVAGQVADFIERWKPDAVFVDQTGVGGGVVDRLRQLGYPVMGVDSASKPTNPRMLNLRAQMWFDMAQWIKGGGCIPNDGELMSELAAPTYWYRSDGKMQLEGKAELKARGLPSPDLADGLALSFSAPVAIRTAIDVAQENARTARGYDYDPFGEGSEARA